MNFDPENVSVKIDRVFEPAIPPGCHVGAESVTVAGSSFKKKACIRFSKGPDLTLQFKREPRNEHDANAILVLGRFKEGNDTYLAKLGYVPQKLAAQVAEQKLTVLPRLRLLRIRGDWITIDFDLLVVAEGQQCLEFLPGLGGETKEAQPDDLPDDPEVQQLISSLQLLPLEMSSLQQIANNLLAGLSDEDIVKLSEINEFDPEELNELDGEELDDFKDDYDEWLLKLADATDFDEIQESASSAMFLIADAEDAGERFVSGKTSYRLFAYEILSCIDEIESELLLEDEMPKVVVTALKSALSHLNQVTSSISDDDVTWRKTLEEKQRREAPLRLAELEAAEEAWKELGLGGPEEST